MVCYSVNDNKHAWRGASMDISERGVVEIGQMYTFLYNNQTTSLSMHGMSLSEGQ
jgi:hypothetical protein